MKKYTAFIACSLLFFFSVTSAFAQQGPRIQPGQQGPGMQMQHGKHWPGMQQWFHGRQGPMMQQGPRSPPPAEQFGYTGPSRTVTAAQAGSLAHKTPVIIRGSIVNSIGLDRYMFRDSSGEISIRIGPREWQNFGANIGPSDNVEITGELHRAGILRDQGSQDMPPVIHVRSIKKL